MGGEWKRMKRNDARVDFGKSIMQFVHIFRLQTQRLFAALIMWCQTLLDESNN
jgi:hypothetical protein